MPLTSKQKQQFKAKAHNLNPVVLLGQHGLTENVQCEVDQALLDHELIKIRIPIADKEARSKVITEICHVNRAELVQTIGHIAVLYRKNNQA